MVIGTVLDGGGGGARDDARGEEDLEDEVVCGARWLRSSGSSFPRLLLPEADLARRPDL